MGGRWKSHSHLRLFGLAAQGKGLIVLSGRRGDGASQRINRTDHPHRPLVEHMRVDHRRLHVGVAQEILGGPDVLPRLKQVGCEGMALMPSSA